MDVRITTRRATVTETFVRQAKERVRKLDRFEPRLHAVDILVDADRGRVSVEVQATVPGAPAMIARAVAATDRSALDGALQKLGRQLRRSRARRLDHQAPPAGALAEE
jgi:ribosomal subunit interface protein